MPISTIPITSAKRVRAFAIFGLACACAFVLWRTGSDLGAAAATESGAKALRAAISMEAGPARDAQLDEAQSAFQRALARHPEDGLSWSRLAEARLLQATGAALGRVSPALLEASIEAGSRAEALGRDSASDLARQAFALSLLAKQERRAATALGASYARDPLGAGLMERRLFVARRVWAYLDDAARLAAQKEACASLADPLSSNAPSTDTPSTDTPSTDTPSTDTPSADSAPIDPAFVGRDGERVLHLAAGGAEAPNAFCRRAGFVSAS